MSTGSELNAELDASAHPAAVPSVTLQNLHFLFLNIGHFLDHLFMLIFATVAALVLVTEWQLGYTELIPYATPGFIAFAAFTIPAGALADRWGREALMSIFFIGIGLASLLTSMANSPIQIAIGLFAIGFFASIYHPVGIAMVLHGQSRTGMRVATNGVWGNLGVAVAALLTGWLIDTLGWRSAFILPGILSVLLGLLYLFKVRHYSPANVSRLSGKVGDANKADTAGDKASDTAESAATTLLKRKRLTRIFAVVFLTTACGGVVFQSTTFALPKVLLEKGGDAAISASMLGGIAFVIFAIGSLGQLVVGYLVDRKSPRPVFIGVALLQVVFFSLTISATGSLVPFLAAGFMLAAFGQIPINDVLVGRVASDEYRSRVLAIRYALTLSTMALSIPLIAWITAWGGISSLFVMLSVIALVIFLCTLALPTDV